tara:strand:+ start:590 stop:1108 length:519 start_codon:yes stop_codon:yes gene_type:complete
MAFIYNPGQNQYTSADNVSSGHTNDNQGYFKKDPAPAVEPPAPPLGIGGLLPFPSLPMPRPGPIIDFPNDNKTAPIKDNEFNFQDQFNSFNKTLGGFKDQVVGFGDQMTGIEKGIMERLTKIEEGIAGLMPSGISSNMHAGIGSMANTDVPSSNSFQGGISNIYSGTNSRGY